MTIKSQEYLTRDDDEELNELLNVMHNSQKVFIDCRFEDCTTKNFDNCNFIACTFADVGASTFTNCQFDSPKFYDGFRGSFYNCDIAKYTGKIGERDERKAL